jgi:hypothetical protein
MPVQGSRIWFIATHPNPWVRMTAVYHIATSQIGVCAPQTSARVLREPSFDDLIPQQNSGSSHAHFPRAHTTVGKTRARLEVRSLEQRSLWHSKALSRWYLICSAPMHPRTSA